MMMEVFVVTNGVKWTQGFHSVQLLVYHCWLVFNSIR